MAVGVDNVSVVSRCTDGTVKVCPFSHTLVSFVYEPWTVCTPIVVLAWVLRCSVCICT